GETHGPDGIRQLTSGANERGGDGRACVVFALEQREPPGTATPALARTALVGSVLEVEGEREFHIPRAIGARVRLTAGTRTQVRTVTAGSSYLSQNDLRAHFGH